MNPVQHPIDRDEARARDVLPTLLVVCAFIWALGYLGFAVARIALEDHFAGGGGFIDVTRESPAGDGSRTLLHPRPGIISSAGEARP